MDDLIQEYLEDLEAVAQAEDDLFPSFLFTYLSNDFEDNYYQRGLADSPLLKEAKKIRRKYSDFFDFQDALETYYEYMDMLAEKYGSIKIVKVTAKEGMIDDYVPPKPKLKNSKKNRALSANGIIPSRQVIDSPEKGTFTNLARELMPNSTGDNIEGMDKKPDKKTRKLYEQAIDRASGVSRKRNMYRSTGISNTEIDFILNYINQANGGKFSSDSNETSNRPLSEILSEIEEEKYIPEEIREDMLTPNTRVIRNGRLSDSNRENQVEIMTLMYEMGIDVFNTYGKNMNKEAVKMVRSAVGGGPLTKKEKKKAKKRAKEEQKRLAHRRNNDAAMERALLRNRFSFDENGNSISMRMSDLIK